MILEANFEELKDIADFAGIGYHNLSKDKLRHKLLVEGQ